MSEDTDERMERAARIRQMREGQRDRAAGDDDRDEPAATDDDQGGTDGSGSDASPAAGDADADAEGGSTDHSPTGADDGGDEKSPEPGPVEEETRQEATAAGAEQTGAADVEAHSDDADAGAEEDLDAAATAAAERAAQAAAAVTGGAEETDGDATPGGEVAAAAAGDAAGTTTATATPMQGPTGVELPDDESIQAAIAKEVIDESDEESAQPATGRSLDAQNAATTEDTVRVLEFTLGDEHYCLDIAHVEEIVKRESITRVPNTPAYVEGVVDLRGQITTILDPKHLLDIDQDGPESLLVVFAPGEFEDQGAIGWIVDEVRQVAPIAKSEVSSPPVDADYIEGVIDRDDDEEFVIWTNPEVAIRIATGERESED